MTMAIGTRLVRRFGVGNELKTVVTEPLSNGKILTKVLDSDGNLIKERLKVILPMEEVGDKFVKSIVKVVQDEDGTNKKIRDIVYHKNSIFDGDKNNHYVELGSRTQYFNSADSKKPRFVSKKYKECPSKNIVTEYTSNGTRGRITKTATDSSLYCNNLGLPVPFIDYKISCAYKDMPLIKIREKFQTEHPDCAFAPFEFGLQSLDESVAGTKLFQFI